MGNNNDEQQTTTTTGSTTITATTICSKSNRPTKPYKHASSDQSEFTTANYFQSTIWIPTDNSCSATNSVATTTAATTTKYYKSEKFSFSETATACFVAAC